MNLLICNCGSSSLSWKLFEGQTGLAPRQIARGKAHRVGVSGTQKSYLEFGFSDQPVEVPWPLPDHPSAIREILDRLEEGGISFEAVGHRIVHGGDYFEGPALLDPTNLEKLRCCLPLAPLHNPSALAVIEEVFLRHPDLPQFVCFDTAFHAGMLPEASSYALPLELSEDLGLRKYGFHGLSYEYVADQAARILERPLSSLRLVVCHLGTGGASVSAIAQGRSVDTSMGYTPAQGLIMGTRCGDIDSEAVLALVRAKKNANEVSRLLNYESGLLGLSGISSDLRDLVKLRQTDPRAGLAFDAYVHRLKLYIGGYAAILGGVDALVFTDDIGVELPELRSEVCRGLEFLGIRLSPELNQGEDLSFPGEISIPGSPVPVLVIPTDEELVIVRQGLSLLGEQKERT